MPMVNIFKELGPDDWSGKKTVKTGQQGRSVITTASSVGTENALPSSSGPGLLSPTRVSSKHSSSSRAGFSSDASSDDNSTTVVNEGRFVEPTVVSGGSDSEEGETEVLDDFSLEGYGACLDCNDIVVDDSPEYIDSVAIDYWRRVKANRKRSLSRKQSIHSLKNIEPEEENDDTQIEVVHDVKVKASPQPPDVAEHQGPKSSKKIMRMVKALSKYQRPSKQDSSLSPAAPASDVDETPDEDTDVIYGNSECYEVEAQLPPKNRLLKLVKMLSNSKLLNKNTPEVAIEHSCASSTENPWDKYSDKYKTPDDSISSDSPVESEEESGEGASCEEEGLEDDCHSEFVERTDVEVQKDTVDVPLEESASQENSRRPSSAELRKSIWHKSITNGASAARAMRSRASLVRIAKSMKFNPEDFSDGSRSSNSCGEVQVDKRTLLRRVSKSARLSNLGKSMKRGVANIRRLGRQKTRSEPNLVVCIDGKGDRLGPSKKRSTNGHLDESETKSDTDPSQDIESQSGESYDSFDDMVVEVDGPVVLQLCLPVMGPGGKPFVAYDDENNSICSSTHSEGRTVNTDWYLTHPDPEPKGTLGHDSVERSSNKTEDGLSRLGIEAPFIESHDGFVPGLSDSGSIASGTDSDVSDDSSSDSSHGDLNTLSEGSEDDSVIYELFPTDSFSSLTGIKCNGGCTRLDPKEEMVRTAQVLVRGRSRVRSHGRHSNKVRVGPGLSSQRDGSHCNKQVHGDEEDSIIECVAEDS